MELDGRIHVAEENALSVERCVRDDGKRALVFEALDEEDRQRLIRFVFECMRTARARTRGDRL